jgi:hypothetical protein
MFITLAILYCLLGTFILVNIIYKKFEEVTLFDLIVSFFSSPLWPILQLIMFSTDKILFQKKDK